MYTHLIPYNSRYNDNNNNVYTYLMNFPRIASFDYTLLFTYEYACKLTF